MSNDTLTVTIAYTSRYGSTRRIADLLAEKLSATAVDLQTRSLGRAEGPLVLLAPIFASRLYNLSLLRKAARDAAGPVAVGIVGITPLDESGRNGLESKIVASAQRTVRVFQLRGAYDPDQLTLLHRSMMSFVARTLPKDADIAATAIRERERCDLVSPDELDPILEWVAHSQH